MDFALNARDVIRRDSSLIREFDLMIGQVGEEVDKPTYQLCRFDPRRTTNSLCCDDRKGFPTNGKRPYFPLGERRQEKLLLRGCHDFGEL